MTILPSAFAPTRTPASTGAWVRLGWARLAGWAAAPRQWLLPAQADARPALSTWPVDPSIWGAFGEDEASGASQTRLDDALASLVYKATRQLHAAGLTAEWRIVADAAALCPPQAVLRGLREVLHSLVAEALAQGRRDEPLRLRVDRVCGETGQHLRLAARAIGPMPTAAHGNSVAHTAHLNRLQRIATQMGAQLDVIDDERMWGVELVLALPA